MRNSLLLVLACLPTAACSPQFFTPGEFGNCLAFCTAFGTKPGEEVRMVRGDTIRLLAYSDSGHSTMSTWRANGAAVKLVNDAGSVTGVITVPATNVLVKAVELGQSTITATAGRYSATPRFTVTDSSAITFMRVEAYFNELNVTSTMALIVEMSNEQGDLYATFPEFTVSDTSRARIERRLDPVLFGAHYVAVPKTAGSVRIIASFRNLRDTLDLRITQ